MPRADGNYASSQNKIREENPRANCDVIITKVSPNFTCSQLICVKNFDIGLPRKLHYNGFPFDVNTFKIIKVKRISLLLCNEMLKLRL